jgi:hypothetical protein
VKQTVEKWEFKSDKSGNRVEIIIGEDENSLTGCSFKEYDKDNITIFFNNCFGVFPKESIKRMAKCLMALCE